MNQHCQSKKPQKLILASTSRYRKGLLERLGLDFATQAPDTDETELPGEAPADRACRLAVAKAAACARPDTAVIGSDQVAALNGTILHKPGTADRAIEQLLACSGQTVDFFTAVCVIHAGQEYLHLDTTRVIFRHLERERVSRYVARDEPLACAGGFRAEALGITLFEAIESRDPSALIGLPLIWLAGTLTATGFDPLGG